MTFHEPIRQQFLQQAAHSPAADHVLEKLLASVARYTVHVEPAHVSPGTAYWRLVGIHHLTPDENRGGHQVLVDVLDENGQRIPLGQAQVRWGWEGQQPNEIAPLRALDKPFNEPATNIDLYANQHVWVEVDGAGLPSDRVRNLSTAHADEPGPNGELWNSWGHHSFYVVFQRSRAVGQSAPPPENTTPEPASPPIVQPAEPKLEVITFGPVSHQDIINAFAQSAGQLGLDDPWVLLSRAGMDVNTLAANRWAAYTGTPLHELPNLTVAERNLLMRQLAHVLATIPVPPTSTPAAPPPEPAPATPPDGTPVPTPSDAMPSDAMQGNRLGFYLHVSTDQDGLWEAIRQVQPPVILVHADTLNRMLLREIRAFRAPDALVIGRLYKDNHTQRMMLTSHDPAAQGRAMADEILALDFGLATERGANGRLLIDAWMSLNEAVPGPASRQFAEQPGETTAMLHAYDLFQVAFHQRLQEAGVEAVAFNFGAGNFSRPEHYLDHFPNTLANYTYLGFHEYGWPTLHPAAGSATSAGLYRACMAGIGARFGPRHRAIITEAGLTRMYQDVGAGDVGWLNSEQSLSQDEYWQTLAWYNQHLLADEYVVGACLFEVGHHGDWATFRHLGRDHAGQPLRLMERIAALNSGTRGRRGGGRGRSRQPATSASVPSASAKARGRGSRSAAGFVRVQGDEFVAGNSTLRFIGVNIRGLVHYGDGRSLPHTNQEHAREQIRAARAMGARVIRVFLPNIHADTQTTIARLRNTITLLRQEAPDTYLLPALSNLYHDVDFRVRGDDRFYEKLDPNFPINLLNAAFFQSGYRENFLPFVQQVVQAFRDEPTIFAWEIGNELKLNPVTGEVESDPNIATFLNFMHTAAQEIRRLDPNHLVTTGMISTRHASLNTTALRERLYGGPDFDFITIHCYNDEYENDDSELAKRLNKPFIIEEAGYGAGFSGHRPAKMQVDMARWFEKGARGYMPWGFMATSHDIGDGDRDAGLDRSLHGDWEPLFNLLRSRAEELARTAPVPAITNVGASTGFQPGQTVYSTDWLNVRRTPGYLNKLGDDILGMLAPAAQATVQGTVVSQDGLLWWPVQAILSDGQSVIGWVAEANASTRLLVAQKPRGRVRRAVSTPVRPRGRGTARKSRSVGQSKFAATWINLRHTPGYVGKPSNDIQGEIPYGAKVEIVGGPVTADGLTWWAVRTPLHDNSIATGWAAELNAEGIRLLADTPPSPPTPVGGNIHGTPLQPGAILTLLGAAQLYASAPSSTQPLGAVQASLLPNSTMTVVTGPAIDAMMEWWQITQPGENGQAYTGWVPLTTAEGMRLLATHEVASSIHVRLPFAQQWPITQGWGERPDFYKQFLYDNVPLKGHNGIDFGTPMNTPLLAVDDGEVIRVDFEAGGFGHFVILRHSWGESLYAHLERVDVPRGAMLAAGQSLGLSGNSGGSSGPHLHFGIRIFPYRRTDGWGGFVNPLPFMQLVALPRSRSHDVMPAPMAPELPGRLRP